MYKQSDRKKIRQAHVAGQFYPGDPVELTKTIAGYFARVDKAEIVGTPLALITPHAGYHYSGQVAAHAYKSVEARSYETVVVIAPSHTAFFKGAAVYDGGTYRTPLGDIPLDLYFVGKLTGIDPKIMLSDTGHEGRGGRYEHSLEVQLPFLQVVLGKFMLVPIVMGDQEHDTCRALGDALGEFSRPGRTLIVASSDLSHFHPSAEAQKLDRRAAEVIEAFAPYDLLKRLDTGECEACGGGPIAAAMIAAHRMGGNRVTILKMANSGDVEPDMDDRVVGYLAAVIDDGKQTEDTGKVHDLDRSVVAAKDTKVLAYSEEEQRFLKRVAFKSIENTVKGSHFPDLSPPTRRLSEKHGVFVTLHKDGYLRGRMGFVEGLKSLVDVVRDAARAAAIDDRRFQPLQPKEIEQLTITITVLSPPLPVDDIDSILIGRDGLLVQRGFQTGFLLPAAAVEGKWDRETFLDETCLAAGLPRESWREEETKVYAFNTAVF